MRVIKTSDWKGEEWLGMWTIEAMLSFVLIMKALQNTLKSLWIKSLIFTCWIGSNEMIGSEDEKKKEKGKRKRKRKRCKKEKEKGDQT